MVCLRTLTWLELVELLLRWLLAWPTVHLVLWIVEALPNHLRVVHHLLVELSFIPVLDVGLVQRGSVDEVARACHLDGQKLRVHLLLVIEGFLSLLLCDQILLLVRT